MTTVRIKIFTTLLVLSVLFLLTACDDAPLVKKQAKPSIVKKKITQLSSPKVKQAKPVMPAKDNAPSNENTAGKTTDLTGGAQPLSKSTSVDTSIEKKRLSMLGITNNDDTKHYQSQGKNDPFKPLIQEKTDEVPTVKNDKPKRILTPLEKIALSQIRLVAVIQTAKKNIAMVEEASGKGYEVTEGTYIGKKEGRITQIKSDRIVIKELVKDYKGRLKEQIQEIKLNKNSDGE